MALPASSCVAPTYICLSPSLCFPPYLSPIAPTPKHTLWLKHPNNWPPKAMGHHNDNHKKLKANLRKWAVLTMLIGTELNAPIEHKHRIHTSLMKLIDPKLYRVDTYTWKFMSRLRKELQRAYQNMTVQRPPTANPTTTIENSLTTLLLRLSNADNLMQAAVVVIREDREHQEQQWEQEHQLQQAQQEQRLVSQERKQSNTVDHTNHSPETLPMPVSVLATMTLNKHNATPAPGCMIQVCGHAKSPQLNGLRGVILSHTDEWRVLLQNEQQYSITQKDLQILSPPSTDHIFPASTNTPASIPDISNSDDNTPRPSTHKMTTVKNNSAKIRSKQNNTPDNNNHAPSAPTSADGPASLSTLNLSPNPPTTSANTTKLPTPPSEPLRIDCEYDEYDNFSCYLEKENSPDASSPTYEPAAFNTSTLPPNPINTHKNMTEPAAHELDPPPTPPTTPFKTSEIPVNNECTDLVIISTSHPTPEQDTAHDSDGNDVPTTLIPGPPGDPPPDTGRTPAPPPPETQEEEGPPDDQGITMHRNGSYKVTVTCAYCHRQHKTGWSSHHDPYGELRNIGWTRGKSRNGNYTWQSPRCPVWSTGQSCTSHPAQHTWELEPVPRKIG